MSLINEALKRAKQMQQDNPTPPPALPFRPAEPSRRGNSGPTLLMIVGAVAVLALAGLLVMLAVQKREPVPPVANARQLNTPSSTPSAVTPAIGSFPAEQTAPSPAQPGLVTGESPTPPNTVTVAGIPSAPTASTNSPAPTDATTNGTVVAADPTPPKSPKLQGIFYRPERPSAVINGKNVYVGTRFAEFQVLAITQDSVTIGSASQTNVLSLE